MTISEIVKEVMQGNKWLCLLDECRQAPERWVDICEALIKTRDKLLVDSVAHKLTKTPMEPNVDKSLGFVEDSITEITDYYIPKPNYSGEIICLPKRVYGLLSLGVREGYCIKEDFTSFDELNIDVQDKITNKTYSEELTKLFRNNTTLIEELKGLSDDDIKFKIQTWAKKGLVENPNNNQKTAFAKYLKAAGLIKCSERTFRNKL